MPQGRVFIWSRRLLVLVVTLLALGAFGLWVYLKASMAQLDGELTVPGLHDSVSVARDGRGVPLISGKDRRDVAYATGYVHAQERFFQMDLLRRVAAGELSELFGARALEIDKAHRLHRFRARAELAFQNLAPADRELFQRYVDGVNDGLHTLKAKPFEYVLAGNVTPRPWSSADSLLIIWTMYLDLQGNQEGRSIARGWLKDHSTPAQLAVLLPGSTEWDAPLDIAGVPRSTTPFPATAPQWWGKAPAPDALRNDKVVTAEFLNTVGSNNWAVAGSRSASGAAIVSDDMHLGIQLPNTWYRLALQFPDATGTRRMVGVSLPGAPLVVVGSNGHVAWSFTNSYGDYMDLVEVTADAANPDQVRTPAGVETLVTHLETILVKDAAAVQFKVRDTSLGPLREVAGRQYALHWVAHAPQAVNVNMTRLESADTVDAALAVAATMGMPAQNFVAGDDKGQIGWTIAGPLPRRNASTQVGAASGNFPLAANDPAARSALWQGWLAPADYPRVINPANGQLWTANSRQLIGEGAAKIGDGGFDLGARSHQIRDDLTRLGNKLDVEAVSSIAFDDRAVFLASWRERAIDVLDIGVLVEKPKRVQFLHLLKSNWNGRASVDSAGYRLTRGFMYALYEIVFAQANSSMAALDPKASVAAATSRWPVLLAHLLDEQPEGWLPAPYRSWNALQLAAIDRAIADATPDGQQLKDATWGQRNTASIAHPMAGAVPVLGRWLAAPRDQLAGDINMPRVAGATFGQSERLTVSPGKEEQGIFNMPGGQSGNPLSPFFLDGHADWVTGHSTPLLPGKTEYTLTFVK